MKKFIVLFAVAAFGLSGCSDDQADKQAKEAEKQPAKAAANDPHANVNMQAAMAPKAAPMMSGNGQGVVKSVTQAGSYTYVELESAENPFWIAVNHTEVKPGDEVAWRDGAVMANFKSKMLDRTFPEIMFVSQLLPAGAQVETAAPMGVVVSVQTSAGYTYAELDTEKGKTWLALPNAELKEGNRVRWNGGSEMRNFYSKSLNKTFDSIWFISAVDVVE